MARGGRGASLENPGKYVYDDDSQTNDDFTVMDVEEEQPEEEAPRPPRRERFEHERSDSMSQGEGTSQQHDEDERSVPKAQRQHQRKRRQESPRKPPVKFRHANRENGDMKRGDSERPSMPSHAGQLGRSQTSPLQTNVCRG